MILTKNVELMTYEDRFARVITETPKRFTDVVTEVMKTCYESRWLKSDLTRSLHRYINNPSNNVIKTWDEHGNTYINI